MNKVCGFAGHGSLTYSEKVFTLLKEQIERVIREDEITEFRVGNYGNFDRLAQRAVREVQNEHPHIRLCLVLPYLTKEITANRKYYEERYDEIILADIPEKAPKTTHIIYANRFMADHASIMICYVAHDFGGAAETAAYAGRRGRKILNLALL